MDTYNERKMDEIAERLLSSADEIMLMLQKVEQGARALEKAESIDRWQAAVTALTSDMRNPPRRTEAGFW